MSSCRNNFNFATPSGLGFLASRSWRWRFWIWTETWQCKRSWRTSRWTCHFVRSWNQQRKMNYLSCILFILFFFRNFETIIHILKGNIGIGGNLEVVLVKNSIQDHKVEISWFSCHTNITWNQFWMYRYQKCQFLPL